MSWLDPEQKSIGSAHNKYSNLFEVVEVQQLVLNPFHQCVSVRLLSLTALSTRAICMRRRRQMSDPWNLIRNDDAPGRVLGFRCIV